MKSFLILVFLLLQSYIALGYQCVTSDDTRVLGYDSPTCSSFTNQTRYEICLFPVSLEHWNPERQQVLGSIECIDPGETKYLVTEYKDGSRRPQTKGHIVTYEMNYHARTRDNRWSWGQASGNRLADRTACLKFFSYNNDLSLSGVYQSTYNKGDSNFVCYGEVVGISNASRRYTMKNATKTSIRNITLASRGSGNSDQDKKEEAKRNLERLKQQNTILKDKVQNCQDERILEILAQDLALIDFAEATSLILQCDDGLRDELEAAKDELERLNKLVTDAKKFLSDTYRPEVQDHLVELGRAGPFDDDFSDLGLDRIYKGNAYSAFSNEDTVYVDVTNSYIDDFMDVFVAADDEVSFNVTQLAWSDSFIYYPDQFDTGTTTTQKVNYLAGIMSLQTKLDNYVNIFEKNQYGYDKDSPIPSEVQEGVREVLIPKYPTEAYSLEKSLQTLKGSLTPEQQKKIVLIEALIHVVKSIGNELVSLDAGMRSLIKGASEALVRFSCEGLSLAAGDFSDFYQVAWGLDPCSGEQLTIGGRAISALSIVVGSAKFWKTIAEARGVSTVVETVSEKVARIKESANKIGLKHADDIESFVDVSQKFGKSTDEVAEVLKSGKGINGHAFEDHLAQKLGGQGPFKKGGRDFDGAFGDAWIEAKSGRYWEDIYSANPNKFKEDMGHRLRIAKDNGKSYHLVSNTPIPEDAKKWLTKKGITYVELAK